MNRTKKEPVGDKLSNHKIPGIVGGTMMLLACVMCFLLGVYVAAPPGPPDTVKAVVMEGEEGAWAKCTFDGITYYRHEWGSGSSRWRNWRDKDGVTISWTHYICATDAYDLEVRYNAVIAAENAARIKKKIAAQEKQ